MRAMFILCWLAAMLFIGLWGWLGTVPANAVQARQAMAVLTVVLAVVPWVSGPLQTLWLRRRPSGGVNLPHAEYWFSGARRPTSIDRLAPYIDAMALMLTVYLCALFALVVSQARHVLQPGAVPALVCSAIFISAGVIWTVALTRAFPRPPHPSAPQSTNAPRPRRPGEPR